MQLSRDVEKVCKTGKKETELSKAFSNQKMVIETNR